MSVTMQQIAKLAGVSRGTVDRVLNNRPGVNPDTYKKIKEIADELNYQPNLAARALKFSHKTCKIGILMMDKKEFTDQILAGIKGVEKSYKEHGVELEIAYCNDTTEEIIKTIDNLIESGVSGLALRIFDNDEINKKVNEVIASGMPVITFNSDIPSTNRMCYIGNNHIAAGRVAADLMAISLQDKGNILLFTTNALNACTTRLSSFINSISNRYPNVNIAEIIEANSMGESLEYLTKYIEKHPDIDGLYLTDPTYFYDSIDFLRERYAGSNFTLIMNDILPSVIEKVYDDNFIKFFIAQEPEKQGMYAVKVLVDYIYYSIVPPKEIYTNIDIRVRDTAAISSTGIFTQSSPFSVF